MISGSSLRVALFVGAAVALIAAAATVQDKRKLALETVDDIEARMASLDPVTRADVVARLGRDAVEAVRAR